MVGDLLGAKGELNMKKNTVKVQTAKKLYSKDFLAALKEVKREGQAPLTVVDADKDFPFKKRD